MKWMLPILVALVAVVGCQQASSPVAETPPSPAPSPTMPKADQSTKDEEKNIKDLVAKQEAAKAAYLKNPKDEKLKKGYVDSSVAAGLQYTYAETVDRKTKYKTALEYFREALKLDPENKDAKQMHDQIVDIYKSLGKPVPGT